MAKSELVKQDNANRIDRIKEHIDELAGSYDDVVSGLFPDAPRYSDAVRIHNTGGHVTTTARQGCWPLTRRLYLGRYESGTGGVPVQRRAGQGQL